MSSNACSTFDSSSTDCTLEYGSIIKISRSLDCFILFEALHRSVSMYEYLNGTEAMIGTSFTYLSRSRLAIGPASA